MLYMSQEIQLKLDLEFGDLSKMSGGVVKSRRRLNQVEKEVGGEQFENTCKFKEKESERMNRNTKFVAK